MNVTSVLLFDRLWWLMYAMPFLGMFFALFTHRVEPFIKDGKVYRHDGAARLEHMLHGVGTVFLIISGVMLGFTFWHGFTAGEKDSVFWLDVHFVAACAFLFGTFFYLSNLIAQPRRGKEHLPRRDFFKMIVNHYGSMLHIKGTEYPREEKYYQSENVAYLYAIGVSALIAVTGLIKVTAHIADLPSTLMAVTTVVHDIAAALMILFLVAHVFFGVIIPSSHATAPSIVTGWQPLEVAKEEHQAWYDAIKDNEIPEKFRDPEPAVDGRVVNSAS